MTKLSFMERRTQQLNVAEVKRENLRAAMSRLPDGSGLLLLLTQAHEMLDKAEWDASRGRDV